ncbi:hypothetical protein C5167_003928 [Papaver somniferum]|nr:hypothetical protein C5167_003928 [Papaver somniferum]
MNRNDGFVVGSILFDVLTEFSSREMNKKMVYFNVCKGMNGSEKENKYNKVAAINNLVEREIHIQLQNRKSDTNKRSFSVVNDFLFTGKWGVTTNQHLSPKGSRRGCCCVTFFIEENLRTSPPQTWGDAGLFCVELVLTDALTREHTT